MFKTSYYTKEEVLKLLDELYIELERVEEMDESTVCRTYNADCKKDIMDIIKYDISTYEDILKDE